jgi:PAS domain S-box-containing protein
MMGVRIVSSEGKTLYANRALLDIYGYSSMEDLISTPVTNRYTPESLVGHEQRKNQRKRGEDGPSEYEIGVVRRDGEVRHLQVFRKGIVWDRSTQFQAFYRDITDRKRAEEALQKSNESLRTLVNSSPLAIISLDPDGKVTQWNPAAEKMFGWQECEALGQLLPYIPEGKRDEHLALRQLVLRGEGFTNVEARRRKKDGSAIDISISTAPLRDPQGRINGIMSVNTDITKRKRAEESLRESEIKFRSYIESSPLAIFVADREGRFVDFNSAALKLLDYDAPAFGKMSILDIHPTEDHEMVLRDSSILTQQGHLEGEYRLKKRDGQIIWVSLHIVMIGDQLSLGYCEDITERKKAQEELRESEQKYRRLHESMRDGFVYVDMAGKIKEFNESYRQMLGYSRGELLQLTYLDLTPERWHVFEQGIINNQVLIMGYSEVYEKEYRRKDGSVFPVELRTFLIKEGNSRNQGMWAIVRDIAKRKRAQEALIQSEERYRRLFEDAVLGIFRTSPEGELLDVNPALAGMFGFESSEQMKEFVSNVTSLYDDPLSRSEVVNTIFETDRPTRTENRLLRKDGTVFLGNLHAWAVRDEAGKVLHLEGFVEDISERKLAEEAIEQLRRQNELILNSAGEGILGLNLEGKHTFVNPAAARMLGFEVDELIGHMGHGVYHHTKESGDSFPEEECPIYQAYRNGKFCPLTEEIFWRKDGTSFPVRYSSAPLMEEGKVLGAVVTFRDITEQKRIEAEKDRLKAQLAQAQKMEAIGTLAGGIAHDFNNILGIIMGYAEIADFALPLDSKVKQDIAEVLKATHRAKDLVTQILTFSRKQDQERRALLVVPVIKEALKLLRSSLPATIEIRQKLDLLQGEDLVFGDPTQIHQILMNLSTNAAHAMRERGGILAVTIAPVDFSLLSDGKAMELSPGKYLKLTVEDTGHGMDRTTLDRIFDPYFTTKGPGEGTGLGLAIVHGIVKSHNGAIIVFSEPGEGTTFHVYLPKLEREALSLEAATTPIPRGSERVLLVDDEEGLANAVKQMLEHLGYRVTATGNSVEALILFRDQPEGFDLVITDYTMPGMTGTALAKEIMNIRPDFPIILCTGFSEKISEDSAKNIGIHALLMKPVTKRGIAEAVRRALDKK